MRLTTYSDYALRILIYIGAKPENELSNINEIAQAYNISKNHLMKITHELGKLGIIETIRGRGGGIKLAMPAEEINIGKIVRMTEDDFNLVPCFGPAPHPCAISPVCTLKHVLNDALLAFLHVLDQYTLADMLAQPAGYRELLGIDSPLTQNK